MTRRVSIVSRKRALRRLKMQQNCLNSILDGLMLAACGINDAGFPSHYARTLLDMHNHILDSVNVGLVTNGR